MVEDEEDEELMMARAIVFQWNKQKNMNKINEV